MASNYISLRILSVNIEMGLQQFETKWFSKNHFVPIIYVLVSKLSKTATVSNQRYKQKYIPVCEAQYPRTNQ